MLILYPSTKNTVLYSKQCVIFMTLFVFYFISLLCLFFSGFLKKKIALKQLNKKVWLWEHVRREESVHITGYLPKQRTQQDKDDDAWAETRARGAKNFKKMTKSLKLINNKDSEDKHVSDFLNNFNYKFYNKFEGRPSFYLHENDTNVEKIEAFRERIDWRVIHEDFAFIAPPGCFTFTNLPPIFNEMRNRLYNVLGFNDFILETHPVFQVYLKLLAMRYWVLSYKPITIAPLDPEFAAYVANFPYKHIIQCHFLSKFQEEFLDEEDTYTTNDFFVVFNEEAARLKPLLKLYEKDPVSAMELLHPKLETPHPYQFVQAHRKLMAQGLPDRSNIFRFNIRRKQFKEFLTFFKEHVWKFWPSFLMPKIEYLMEAKFPILYEYYHINGFAYKKTRRKVLMFAALHPISYSFINMIIYLSFIFLGYITICDLSPILDFLYYHPWMSEINQCALIFIRFFFLPLKKLKMKIYRICCNWHWRHYLYKWERNRARRQRGIKHHTALDEFDHIAEYQRKRRMNYSMKKNNKDNRVND